MATADETRGRRRPAGLLVVAAAGLAGCVSSPAETPAAAADSWSVTAWGDRFEVFPEVELLVAGEVAVAYTHVTRLDGFTPLVEGRVEVVLTGPSGEQVFAADRPSRPGIFAVEIEPAAAGDYELAFRVHGRDGSEEIRGGKVRAGSAELPGGIRVAPAPRGAADGGEPLTFLKEEQWRSDFATDWVRSGELAASVAGLARILPPAGGEAWLSSPVDGVLGPTGARVWPFAGLRVGRGDALFEVIPRVAADRSLAVLEAELAALAAELEPSRTRLSRLQELLALGAASRREVEDARVRVETLTARHAAADRDLTAARRSRLGSAGAGAAGGLTLRAPFAGEIARVSATPQATVAAGEPLARVVRTDAVWIEVSLSPAAARQIAAEGASGVVLSDPESPPLRLEDGLRLVAVAPELEPRTGTVSVVLEAPAAAGLTLGTTFEAQILSPRVRRGIVVPASAVIDDAGIPVVYLQLSGESFVRQAVHVLERQGERLLVDHLTPGQRLVTRGGEAIRRASLMASGEAHGHVH